MRERERERERDIWKQIGREAGGTNFEKEIERGKRYRKC